MSYYKTKPVPGEPRIRLSHWRIFRTDDGDNLFVGYDVADHDVRVSAPISGFDVEGRRGIAQGGELYELLGSPDCDPHASYACQMHLAVNEHIEAADVTEQVLSGKAVIGDAQ
jgi:hypothetical protein